LITIFQVCLALLIVSVPEGMPLAISMALAFSFDKLTNDNVLVKKQAALETAGCLTDICTSKTSTLTKGDLYVAKFFIANTQLDTTNPQMNLDLLRTIGSLVTMNTSAYLETNDQNWSYVPCGSPLEVAMLRFLISNQVRVQDHFVERERMFKHKATAPFSSQRKRMTTAYKMTVDGQKVVRVVVKGAPEDLIAQCTSMMNPSNQKVEFHGNQREGQDFLENVVSWMAKDGYKPLIICYKDIKAD
jgi:magnesium-transporting ATPase (P-type)